MHNIEQQFGINLFDRFNLAYRSGSEVRSVPRDEFERMLKDGTITNNTIVFNNLAKDLTELENNWEVPFKDSWHARLFGNLIAQ